jgi:uncharacterized protein YjiK
MMTSNLHLKHRLLLGFIFFLVFVLLMSLSQQIRATAVGDWDLNYHYAIGEPITLPGIKDNLSGLTYHPGSDSLFAVLNNPEQLIELSKQGDILRQVPLRGFSDTESLDYLGNGLFVVTEERRRQLVFFYIDVDTEVIDYEASQAISLGWTNDGNRGYEGVAWSPRHGFFIIQEAPPKLIHHTMHDAEAFINVEQLNRVLPSKVSDYAGLSLLQAAEDYLLVLSEASHSLNVLNLEGEPLSSLSLRTGLMRLWPLMEQPEGVAVDNDGHIYIVGEPNQMLKLIRKTRLAQLPPPKPRS